MLTDGHTDGCTDGRTDDGRKVITIAHPEQSSGELKIQSDRLSYLQVRRRICRKFQINSVKDIGGVEDTAVLMEIVSPKGL